MDDIGVWLELHGLGKYAEVFAENEIDTSVLPRLSESDLKELGLPIGARRKLQAAVEADVSHKQTAADSVSNATAHVPPDAERRQLTVMFADLVGWTALSEHVDPEDLREITRAYQDCAQRSIETHGGFIARYMGDGVLAYFGFPHAKEDDPAQALRAGLTLVKRVADMMPTSLPPTVSRLSVRVGIATGTVIVGDIVGEGASQESAVTGETANLAARLQAVAVPGSVVIGATTRDLVGPAFECEALPAQHLKGFDDPVPVYQVVKESELESRFEASGRTFTPHIGREEEQALCASRWEQVLRGEGQVVMLAGEPGIGKSRLVAAVRAAVDAEAVVLQCSPRHENSPLHPVLRYFERAAPADSSAADVLAALLALQSERADLPAGWNVRDEKVAVLDRIVAYLHERAARAPTICAVEDLHWADPTTLELVDRLVRTNDEMPQLLLLTFRPEYSPPWVGRAQALFIALRRLSRAESAGLAERVLGDHRSLDRHLLDEIVARADGVPLFIEELTRAVVESGENLEPNSSALASIPATLQDSLTVRLDALSSGRALAQCGAVIGREFSRTVLYEIAGLSPEEFDEGLNELERSGLVSRRGEGAETTFVFKHALVQDAAYSTLLRERRRTLHLRVASALSSSVDPEVLAHHYFHADELTAAVDLWRQAGEMANRRSAEAESIAHFKAALATLESLPADGSSDPHQELAILVAMIQPLMAVTGYASDAVSATCARARALCGPLDAKRELAVVLAADSLCRQVGGDIPGALDSAEELLALSLSLSNPSMELAARGRLAVVEYFHGEFESTELHLGHTRRLNKGGQRGNELYLLNDPIVETLVYASLTWWTTGRIDDAVNEMNEALRLSHELEHPFTRAYVLPGGTWLFQRIGDVARTEKLARELIQLCEKYQFRFRETQGRILLAWVRCMRGDLRGGLNDLELAIEACRATGAGANFTYYWALAAEQYLEAGEPARAASCIDTAFRALESGSEHHWEVDLHRLRARQAITANPGSFEEAEMHLRRALDVARRQSARMLALRSTVALCEILQEQGRHEEALGMLEPIHSSFDQGLGTPDLIKAEQLLETLR